ncbi:iron uptake transporter deferrochelatase/peroxidase subunit [Cellulomonas fimi]|uniref:Deferrochelatase n=1 Tax=Cellulomonas fimi (strain ATCC 484 / DSM 20113 / JCM 1341 / CCUG 24087 / LMG 16345 / NBRC 15513 / NCIMB 8980 / NCTC 7547 / NRS-133) TaxID=590998 RepID=F4H811_CELFA|nr:iron uptake transporter deferrochelatase/peroxidase subunit [Cellulomonas fimi]AEE46972.1 Dyp-type peroxidase family [Cellulomonas fimi ATCC 484]NNH07505.1 deferrochelatase/peroxidase EfeB [Cellulomonas fimi]VEH34728.1 Probable deferrochelatase/peroxidase EfeN precursor [Cellulomonas fimi]
MTTPDDATHQAPETGLSRRALLGLGGGIAAVAAAAGFGAARGTAAAAAPSAAPQPGTFAFTGAHQAGVVTPAQDRLYLAAFDVTTDSREELVALLRRWTTIAARLTQGLPAGPLGPASGPYDAPPDDTGEAADLPPAGLTLTFGFGRSLFVGTPGPDGTPGTDRFGLADRLPGGLVVLPHFSADDLDPARSDGDLVVQACADDPQVAVHAIRNLSRAAFGAATIRWTQLGYGRTSSTTTAQRTPRNLFGFKDGTANVKAEEEDALAAHVWVPADAADADAADGVDSAWLTGGTYLVARRIRMTIETWDRTSLREQETLVGRTKGEGAPLSGGTEHSEPDFTATGRGGAPLIAANSHVRLAHPDQNDGVRMLRRGYNFTDGNDALGRLDAGLFFLAFVRDPRTHFIPMQSRLSAQDGLMEYLEHTGSGLFAVPRGVPDGALVLGADGTPATTDDSPFVGQDLFA